MDAPSESKPRVYFEFEVEKVIGIAADGRFRVQWAPAWVSKFHLMGCEHLIQEFIQQQADKLSEHSFQQPEFHLEPDDQLDIIPSSVSPQVSVPKDMIVLNGDTGSAKQFERSHGELNDQEFLQPQTQDLDTMRTKQHSIPDGNKFICSSGVKGETDVDSSYSIKEPHDVVLDRVFEQKDRYLSYDMPINSSESDISPSSPILDICHELTDEQESELVLTSVKSKSIKARNYTEGKILMQNSDTPPISKKIYTCNMCSRWFTQINHLQRHFRVHTDERPFHCRHCPKSFTHKRYLSAHLRIHTGLKPYQCSVCGKTFTDKSNYNRHVKLHTQ